ncbi:hypothetical protein Tco_0146155 [Tanacetum coccineum]
MGCPCESPPDGTRPGTNTSDSGGVSRFKGVILGIVYHDLYLGGKALVERENMGFDLTKSNLFPSFIEDLTTKGMSLCVADSNTGNHHEDGFTPLETIRMLLSIIWEKIPFELEGEDFELERRIVLHALNDKPTCYGISCSLNVDYSRVGLEMDFRNFIYAKNEEDLSFLPKEPSPGFGTGPPSILVNTKPPNVDAEPTLKLVEDTADFGGSPKPEVFVVHPGSVSTRIKDMRRSRELLQVIEKIRGECDVMKERERAREEECEELRTKCEAAMNDFEKNLTVVAMLEKMSTLSTEAKEHKANLDMMMLESQKWAGYQVSLSTLESKVASLEAEKARLEVVKVSLRKEVDDIKRDMMEVVLKRCAAFEKVADMKEPFDLPKVKAYRPSYKKEHTQAGNELATATFP